MFGNALRKAAGSRRVLLAALAVTGLGVAGVAIASPASAATTLNVKTDCGAAGNGSTNDSAAINKCVQMASAASGGGTIHFPSGNYKSANTVHLMSHVTFQLDAGATIQGASGTGYDNPEPNPNDNFQDFGHSHFHDAMFFGDRLTDLHFIGPGTIDGMSHLITGNPGNGQADKIISLTRCSNLTFSDGFTLRHGGHFAILINGCDQVTADNLKVLTSTDRDAWNIISTTHVTITNSDIQGNDDAIVFKSDYALGAKLPNGHVTVTDTHASAGCCNALMFGSETCGDFTDYNFQRINITGASKSGLGMVSMDGANISDVHYRDITVSNVASPIMQKIGTRKRCGNNPGVGHISNVTYDNITIHGKSSPQFTATIWGESGGNQISNVTFNNVKITVPGGSGAMSTAVPSNDPKNYNPNSIGKRPAYGWYVHNANNITWNNSTVDVDSGDARPAVIANTGSNLQFNSLTAERSTGSTDVLMQNVNGYCVTGADTSGGALRVSQTGSTQSCGTPANDFSIAATPGSQTVPAGGGTATYNVSTAVVSGTPGNVTLTASGLPAGASASFAQNPIAAGASTTMTVTTTAGTPSGNSSITVTGTAGSATHTASVGLTVGTGGGGLTLSDLSVKDTANAADWSLQTNLRTGVAVYGDRAFTFASVPSGLQGKQWIRTANDSKSFTGNPLVTFTVSQQATVAVGVDTRVGRPSWIDGSWTDTGTSITTTEGGSTRTLHVFQKSFAAGQVALGPHGVAAGTGSLYTVAVF